MSNIIQDPPIVTGVPVEQNGPYEQEFQDINQTAPAIDISIPMVEVDEISTEGWLCLILGCFICPGFNLLGLCMRDRRLVPASNVEYVY